MSHEGQGPLQGCLHGSWTLPGLMEVSLEGTLVKDYLEQYLSVVRSFRVRVITGGMFWTNNVVNPLRKTMNLILIYFACLISYELLNLPYVCL